MGGNTGMGYLGLGFDYPRPSAAPQQFFKRRSAAPQPLLEAEICAIDFVPEDEWKDISKGQGSEYRLVLEFSCIGQSVKFLNTIGLS